VLYSPLLLVTLNIFFNKVEYIYYKGSGVFGDFLKWFLESWPKDRALCLQTCKSMVRSVNPLKMSPLLRRLMLRPVEPKNHTGAAMEAATPASRICGADLRL
jgi:hypothetical protein